MSNLLTIIRLYTQDLAALSSMGSVLQLIQHLADLQGEFTALAAESGILGNGWTQLATDGLALCDGAALRGWSVRARQWSVRGNGYARQAQALTQRSTNMLSILISLLTSVQAITGSTSGLQSATALMGVAAHETQKLAQALDGQTSLIIGEHLIGDVSSVAFACIQQADIGAWGTYTPPWSP